MFAVSSLSRLVYGRNKIPCWMTKAFSSDITRIREEFGQHTGGSVDLKFHEKIGIAELCLNHPEKKNALSGAMMVDFADAVTNLEQWTEGKGVILHASGDVFCSGGDLDMVQKICTSRHGFEMATLMHDTLLRFQSLPLISVALVQGNAIGGGAELAIQADFRLATPGGSFRFMQKRLGVVTGWGGGTRLVKLLGPSKALEILASCKKISPDEALNLGLISAILKPELDYLSQAHEWLSLLTSGPPQVVRAMKSIVSFASQKLHCDSLLEEKRLFTTVWGGEAQKTALEKILKNR